MKRKVAVGSVVVVTNEGDIVETDGSTFYLDMLKFGDIGVVREVMVPDYSSIERALVEFGTVQQPDYWYVPLTYLDSLGKL